MKKRILCFAILGCLVLVLGAVRAEAQATASGTIQGTVLDKSQAAVAGAEVTVTNKATGTARTTTSSDTGYYRFDLLSAGVYTVKVTKAGFTTIVETIELPVGQTTTTNVTLNPGAISEVVEVTTEAPIIDLTKTSVSQNISPTEVQELPLLGRDVANLAYLAPGVKATDSYDPTKNRYAILSVNGQSGRNVNVTINGVDNKDKLFGFFAFERQRENTSISEDPTALAELQIAKTAGLAADPSAIIPRPFY